MQLQTTHKDQPSIKLIWKKQGKCLIGHSEKTNNLKYKVAAFDLDGTLIKTKSGSKFPKNQDDWTFLNQAVIPKIKQLNNQGYIIAIFTNQLGIQRGIITQEQMMNKLNQIIANFQGVQVFIAVSTSDDKYRKPSVEMWKIMVNHYHGQIDPTTSFFCGDSAGRKNGSIRDFSDSDLKFAINVGVSFLTPQNLFQNEQKRVEYQGFDPKNLPQHKFLFEETQQESVHFVPKELVIFCGPPGSGKSVFWKNYMSQYQRLNMDSCKTRAKAFQKAKEFMTQQKSIVFDFLNSDSERRKQFVNLAGQFGYKVRIFVFKVPLELCSHNMKQIKTNQNRQHLSVTTSRVAMHAWFKKFEQPTLQEGFYEVKHVNFIPKFENEEDKRSFYEL